MEYADRLKQNLALSDEISAQMKLCTSSLEQFSQLLKEYIRLRYVIDDTDFWTDNIRELARFSMEHQQEMVGNGDEALKDTSLNCAGATSAETKQILLLMQLRKDLGVNLPADYIGTAKSVADIAQRLFSQLA